MKSTFVHLCHACLHHFTCMNLLQQKILGPLTLVSSVNTLPKTNISPTKRDEISIGNTVYTSEPTIDTFSGDMMGTCYWFWGVIHHTNAVIHHTNLVHYLRIGPCGLPPWHCQHLLQHHKPLVRRQRSRVRRWECRCRFAGLTVPVPLVVWMGIVLVIQTQKDMVFHGFPHVFSKHFNPCDRVRERRLQKWRCRPDWQVFKNLRM